MAPQHQQEKSKPLCVSPSLPWAPPSPPALHPCLSLSFSLSHTHTHTHTHTHRELLSNCSKTQLAHQRCHTISCLSTFENTVLPHVWGDLPSPLCLANSQLVFSVPAYMSPPLGVLSLTANCHSHSPLCFPKHMRETMTKNS